MNLLLATHDTASSSVNTLAAVVMLVVFALGLAYILLADRNG